MNIDGLSKRRGFFVPFLLLKNTHKRKNKNMRGITTVSATTTFSDVPASALNDQRSPGSPAARPESPDEAGWDCRSDESSRSNEVAPETDVVPERDEPSATYHLFEGGVQCLSLDEPVAAE